MTIARFPSAGVACCLPGLSAALSPTATGTATVSITIRAEKPGGPARVSNGVVRVLSEVK